MIFDGYGGAAQHGGGGGGGVNGGQGEYVFCFSRLLVWMIVVLGCVVVQGWCYGSSFVLSVIVLVLC